MKCWKQGCRAWVVGGAVLLAAGSSRAASEAWDVIADPTNGFGGLTAAWSLADPDSAYAEWNVFDSYPSDASPDVGSFGLGSASVTENTGAAFLTGGGNIYSFSAATDFTVDLAGISMGGGGSRSVALHFETLGTSLDPASVTLTVGGTTYLPDISSLLYSQALGGFGGAEEERVFIWNSVPDGPYTFDFNASGSSMSLSRFAEYASPAAAPEPHELVLLGLSLAGLSLARRRSTVPWSAGLPSVR